MGVLLYDSDVGSENTPRVRRLLRNFSIFPFGLTNWRQSFKLSIYLYISESFENLTVKFHALNIHIKFCLN